MQRHWSPFMFVPLNSFGDPPSLLLITDNTVYVYVFWWDCSWWDGVGFVRLQGVWHLVVNTHLGLLINQPSVHVSALIPILTLLPPVPSFIIFLKIISIVPFLVGRGRRRSCNLIVDCKIIGERTTDVLPPCNLTGCLVLYQVPCVLFCGVLCPVLLVLVPPI